jgi:hypothetical protein
MTARWVIGLVCILVLLALAAVVDDSLLAHSLARFN